MQHKTRMVTRSLKGDSIIVTILCLRCTRIWCFAGNAKNARLQKLATDNCPGAVRLSAEKHSQLLELGFGEGKAGKLRLIG